MPPITPRFTLRREDNGTRIKPFDPEKLNRKPRKFRRNAASSDSEDSDSDEPPPYRRYSKNMYPAFSPVPYNFQTNPFLKHITNTQTRIATELNKTRSRALEWKRNETQIRLANQIIQTDTTPTTLPSQQLDHSYSQPLPEDRPKLRLHASWEPQLRDLEPLTSNKDSPLYPWDDSEDDPVHTPKLNPLNWLNMSSTPYPHGVTPTTNKMC